MHNQLSNFWCMYQYIAYFFCFLDLNGAVFWMRPQKSRSHVTTVVTPQRSLAVQWLSTERRPKLYKPSLVQSLKRSTFPFLRSFTVRSPSVHRAFSVRSSCLHRSHFFVQRSPFARVHRSQSVHRSLTVRSPIVHKAFIVHSAFSLHCHSEL